jgi:acetolactate synthase-1/2/3 large subunit
VTLGSDLLCRALEENGVSCVFAVPGTQTIPLHEALRRSRIRVVLTTHELAASFMANGYYRSSGRVAPVVTIPGPGFTYALPGVAEALHDSVALLHVVGCTPSADPRQHFQALDQRAIALPLVKGANRIDEAKDIPTIVEASLQLALDGEPGPVLLEWTPEALAADASGVSVVPAGISAEVDAAAVERAAELVATASRPVLLAGQGCSGASDALRELAELLGAPVITTSAGRGVLAEDHPLALGFDLVRSTTERARELLGTADLIVALGCKLGATFALDVPADRLVRVDTSPATLASSPNARASLLGSCDRVLAVLNPAVRRRRRPGASEWQPIEIEGWRQRLRTGVDDDPEPVVRGAHPSTAAAFFSALRAVLPRDGIVVADSGLHQTLLRRHFDVLAHRGLLFPTDFQSMGFGLPAAIGAGLAAPARPIVAVVGDGGFAMSGLELLTAVRERVPLTVVVFVDGVLNRIRLTQLSRYGRSAHVDLANPDFALFAEAVGARYARCDGDADVVLRQAIDSGEVTLVEVPVGDSSAIHASRAQGLARAAARQALRPRGLQSLRHVLRRWRGGGKETQR